MRSSTYLPRYCMIKNILLTVVFACMLATLSSCSSSSGVAAKTPELPFMIGRIDLIGNEPFVKPVLWIDQSHLFKLRASKDLEQELVSHQRKRVRLYYSGRQEIGTDHYLDVDHIESLENKK
jgi:hypothetical protein